MFCPPLPAFPGNVLAAGLHELGTGAAAAVERDAAGLPIAWRLFAFGPFTITKDGQTFAGEFTRAHADRIMAHAAAKGNRIPIDAEHGLYALAQQLGVDESELAGLLNRRQVALGYGELALRDGGVWLQGVQWTPLARRILAEGVLRWFSPVIRGLSDGRLRITSVALTNTPALDRLDAIAASAEDVSPEPGAGSMEPGVLPPAPRSPLPASTAPGRLPGSAGGSAAPGKGAVLMDNLLRTLGALAGISDVAALKAETAEAALLPKLEPLIKELPELRAGQAAHAALVADLRSALALAAEAPAEAVRGAVLALVEKAKADASALSAVTTRVQALEADATAAKRQKLLDDGLAAGKLTPALVDKWAKNQDIAVLTAYLENAPVILQPGRTVNPQDLPSADAAALTAEDAKVATLLGIEPKKMQETKKAQRAA